MLPASLLPSRLGQLGWRYSQLVFSRDMSAGAASSAKSTYAVPEGHHSSDLSSAACHIGLGRRRDLTMRQDLRLYSGDQALTLAQVFHTFKTLLVGFPGGKICTQQHVPGYTQSVCTAAYKYCSLGGHVTCWAMICC
eukprot:GHRQ01020619.1.p1 GENE.GHRQ01020619.1~~GHRQ01020619.1.p1  ORF type:complete len:137 (+),score=12.60 GHRQ01020619.1:81-491(+)